jgi:hypothetical protein
MNLFTISNRGLLVIAVLVAVLWGVIFAERAIKLQAQRDYQELMELVSPRPVQTEQEAKPPVRSPLNPTNA